MTKRCEYRNKLGVQCKGYATKNSVFCFYHDPALAETRKAARSRGGMARHGRVIGTTGPVELAGDGSVSDVRRVLWEEVNHVRGFEKSHTRAKTIASLAAILLRVFEVGEIESRLTILENKLLGKDDTKNAEQD